MLQQRLLLLSYYDLSTQTKSSLFRSYNYILNQLYLSGAVMGCNNPPHHSQGRDKSSYQEKIEDTERRRFASLVCSRI